MSTMLKDSEKVTLGPVSAVDAKGNPTALGGPVTFALSDDSMGTLTPSEDGLSCDFAAGSKLGDVQVQVSDTVLSGTADLTIVAGAEASLSVPVGAPVSQ